ncbi:MAG: PilC/PilY family type IV pilus protein [Burkholderiales bacterium]|nr:PilC/PilY family type IV pilus protein [Burkholderiales bacterium]
MNSILELFGHGRTCSALRSVLALAVATLGMGTAFAAQTDISSTPFSSTTSAQAKPNIMLLMDTSESMSRSHMPDEVEAATGTGSVGYKAAQCNVLYYNRNQTYLVPKRPDGTLFPTPSFTGAPYAGYVSYYVAPDVSDLSTVDLSASFIPYETKTLRAPPVAGPATAGPAYYYHYVGTQTLSYAAAPCTDTDNLAGTASKAATGGGTWYRVVVGATSGPANADERTNFAIWYSYYRTRMSLTKSAASLAFTPLTDSFRVGFITVKPKDAPSSASINPNKYLAINDFNSTQRTAWFSKLFSQAPDGSSPAREGLARVGRHYAGMTDGINSGMAEDPVQYSCQQNFTIMTTDGYWNAGAETPSRGAVQMDGTTLVGQQDGALTDATGLTPRPLWDGSLTSVQTTRDASNFYYDANCMGAALLRTTSQRLASTKQYTASSVQTQESTQQYTTSTRQALQSTAQYTRSTVQTNRTTQQYTLSTVQTLAGTTQRLASTVQRSRVTQQYTTSTRQIFSLTEQYTRATSQTRRTTLQYSTASSQTFRTTYQRTLATQQYRQGQTQLKMRQYQILSYDGLTERDTPVASCTPGGSISCSTREVMPLSPVASCTAGTTGAPNHIVTTCTTTTLAAVAPIASCTPGTTTGGAPNYITSTCTNTTTAATLVASCTPGTSSSGSPNYITSTCTAVPLTSNVAVASCTNGNSGAPNYITTACNTTTSAATPGPACTPGTTGGSTSPFIRTICTASINLVNVNVPSSPVCTNQTAGSGNAWTSISCTTTTTPATPINSTCTPGTTNNASYLYTTCARNTITANAPTNVATCTTGFGAGPNYYRTVCSPTTASTPVGVASCTPGTTIGAAPNYIRTTCAYTNNTVFLATATTCTPVLPTSGNGYLSVACNTATTPPTPVASCTLGTTNNGAPNWVYTTCTQTTTPAVPVATCVAGNSGPPNYIVTTCTPVVTAPVGVLTCVPGTTTGPAPNYLTSTCTYNNVTVPVAAVPACANQTAAPGNQFTTIGCTTITTPTVNAPACTPGVSVNGSFVYTTCTRNDLTANVPVASCTPSTAASPSFLVTTCPPPIDTAPVGVAACTPGTTTGPSPNFIQTTCALTNTANYVPNAGACVAEPASASNNYEATTCNTTTVPAAFVASCTPGFSTTGSPNYINTTCVEVPGTPPTPVATCTGGVGPAPDYVNTTCTDGPGTGPTPVLACAAGNSGAPDYITTTCATGTAPGLRRVYDSTITSVLQNFSGNIPIGSPTAGPTTTLNNQPTDGICYITGLSTPPALPVPNPYRPAPAEPPLATASAASCTGGWPCVTSVSVAGGSTNSLADVAQYYYVTDLRPGATWPNTGPGSVPAIGGGPEDDRATWQHMTTFTIALGVSGTLNYRSDYRSSAAITGDFADIRTGAKSWPIWPDPAIDYSNQDNWNNARSIDDYWHTAVNGRGQYFSAGNPTSVIAGLSGALAGITARVASGSSAGASSLQPTAGDNFAFVASYVTSKWTGDVRAELIDLVTGVIGTTTIDPLTGAVVPGAPVWSAQTRLDALTGLQCDNRQIFLLRAGATDNKVNFSWNTQACDATMLPVGGATTGLNAAEQAHFTGANITVLSQYPSMTDGTAATVDQRTAAAGANLVNFLRGQRGNEGFESGTANKLYRDREHVLGDMVNAQPVYVKGPFADYGDAGYQAFKTANAARTPMVYSAANDGMLHAFYAGTSVSDPDGGREAWAIIPSAVLPNLFKLADANYKNTHQYFVDGTPTVGDIYDTGTSSWKTMLVAGLNAGGKSYYALDVTDPATPRGLWEFKWSNTCYDGTPATAGSDCHLGFSFGRPVITKLSSGQWVVMFTSGYNNISSPAAAGDGVGYLYVLNAATGQIIHKLSTGVGDSTTPSGLGQINNFVDNTLVNNTTVRVYGGDMLGNVWRFDVNDNLAPGGREASLVGTTTDTGGTPQPITVRPELAEVNGKPMVFVSTGRLLGASDVSDLQVQSIYGIIDPLTGNPAYTNLRSVLKPLAMAQVGAGPSAYRTVACTGTTAQCGTTNGWVVNLPDSGERVNINMELVLGTLIVGSNVPQSTACSSGGYGWINYLDFASGLAVTGSPNQSVSVIQDGGLIAGIKTIQLPNGEFRTEIRKGDGTNAVGTPPIGPAIPRGNRISWREIAQ